MTHVIARTRGDKRRRIETALTTFSESEAKYYSRLADEDREKVDSLLEELANHRAKVDVPLMFRVMQLDLSMATKAYIIKETGENISRYLEILETIPFNVRYSEETMTRTECITRLRTVFDTAVTGHEAAKRKIIRHISHPDVLNHKKSLVIGLRGVQGMGQAAIVRAMSKAMSMELVRVNLRECSSPGYLNGRRDTEPSHGQVVSGLIRTRRMNPIFQFDNLDMMIGTLHGAELESVMLRMTDTEANHEFEDKFLEGVKLDLTGSPIVFTYTNRNYIHPVLRDRMIEVDIEPYDFKQKMNIVQTHLLPASMDKYDLPEEMCRSLYRKDFMTRCIQMESEDGGMSRVEKLLDTVCAEMDLLRVMREHIPDGLELLDDIKVPRDNTSVNMMYI